MSALFQLWKALIAMIAMVLLLTPHGIQLVQLQHRTQPIQPHGIQRQELLGIQPLPPPRQSQPESVLMTGSSRWRDVSSSTTRVKWR